MKAAVAHQGGLSGRPAEFWRSPNRVPNLPLFPDPREGCAPKLGPKPNKIVAG